MSIFAVSSPDGEGPEEEGHVDRHLYPPLDFLHEGLTDGRAFDKLSPVFGEIAQR